MKILLFSGGIDSTCLAWSEKPDRLAFIDYGQVPAAGEERACRTIAAELQLPLDVHRVDMRHFGGGSMAGAPEYEGHPPEFWPFRNQMLITLAAMAYADANVEQLLVGTVLSDRQHPDGRASFLRSMRRLLLTQSSVVISAPAARLSTPTLVLRSKIPQNILGWTFSCHTGEWACGQCRGCIKHDDVLGGLGILSV